MEMEVHEYGVREEFEVGSFLCCALLRPSQISDDLRCNFCSLLSAFRSRCSSRRLAILAEPLLAFVLDDFVGNGRIVTHLVPS